MDKYVDADFILELYNKQKHCLYNYCGKAYMSFEKSNPYKVTLNRINNNLPHYKDNCVLMCKICNSGKSNKE